MADEPLAVRADEGDHERQVLRSREDQGARTPRELCETGLRWARESDYAGWDPYDGLNSPLVEPITGTALGRLIALHGVRLSPVNLRPLLQIPKERNPKGIALFADALLRLYGFTDNPSYRSEAESLLDWLVDATSPEHDRFCWGYNFDWQSSYKFFLPAYHPCVVVTVFCGRAFLQHYRLTGDTQSRDIAVDAAEFIRSEMNRISWNDHEVFSYTPYDTFLVVNANALAADYFRQIAASSDTDGFERLSRELVEFVIDVQEPNGAWYYAVPPEESHLSSDNFHTGFVLESLHGFAKGQPADDPTRRAYQRGMEFYRNELFEANGAPRFEADKRYPYDVHAAAQGLITLAQGGTTKDRVLADRLLNWTIKNLYDQTGYFYRRKGRLLRDRTPYMRWSQAWMVNALSRYCEGFDRTD